MSASRLKKLEGPFWIFVGIVISLLAWKTKVGTFHQPGPGFAAFITGLFIVGIGLAIAFFEAFSKTADSFDLGSAFKNVSWSRIVYTMVLLVAYGLLLDMLGYVVTTFLVMIGLFCDRDISRWRSSLLFSLGITAISYVVFDTWLHCQFPRGIFPWW